MNGAYRRTEYRIRYPGEGLVALLRGRLHAYERLAATGGDLCFARVGRYRVCLLNHPDLVQELLTEKESDFSKGEVLQHARCLFGNGLLTSEGATHRKHRKLVSRAFHHARIRAYADTMVDLASSTAEKWLPGRPLVIGRQMMELTLKIVATTLFGTSAGTDTAQLEKAFARNLRLISRRINPIAKLVMQASGVDPLQRKWATRRLNQLVDAIVDAGTRRQQRQDDLLDMLLEAGNAGGESRFTHQEVRDEIITLIVSGHETTAVALTWVWYMLSKRPDLERRLHREIDVLGGSLPRFDDLERLVFTRQLVAESLRLYAPLWSFARQATRRTSIGGHEISQGEYVLVSPLLLHRSDRYWREPLQFEPDRFAPGAQPLRPKFAYFPFSAGPRGCIGEQFAWTEAVLVVATIAQRWRLRKTTPRDVRPAAGLLTLRPSRPVLMSPEPRC